MSEDQNIMRDLHADIDGMLRNAATVKGARFAALASFALTMKQVLREHARLASFIVRSGLVSQDAGAAEGESICALVHGLFQSHLTALGFEPSDVDEIDEALEFSDALFHRIEVAESRLPD